MAGVDNIINTNKTSKSQLLVVSFPATEEGTTEFYVINPEFSANAFTLSQLPIPDFALAPIHIINLGYGLAVTVGRGHRFCLYNPIRGQKLILPPSTIDRELLMESPCLHGLGFDNSTKQYKVVRLLLLPHKGTVDGKGATEVYVLGSNKWRQITAVCPYSVLLFLDGGTSAYGDAHWIVKEAIVSFEFTKEKFKVSPLPYATLTSFNSLFNWREELALLERSPTKINNIQVWVLRDYDKTRSRWEKMYALSLHPYPTYCKIATWMDGFVFDISKVPWLVNGKIIGRGSSKLLHWNTTTGSSLVTINPELPEFLNGNYYEIFETHKDNLDLARYADSVSASC